jgi:hypothetical protein
MIDHRMVDTAAGSTVSLTVMSSGPIADSATARARP